MAQTNSTIEPLNLEEDKQRMLARLGSISYNIGGFLPNATEWCLTLNQIKDIIFEISKAYLSDLYSVTVDDDYHDGGKLHGFAWLPADSENVTNKNLIREKAVVRRSTIVYSDALKEYMDKFAVGVGNKKYPRLIPAVRNEGYKGIELDIQKFMRVEFDENSYEYGKLIGNNFKRKMKITLIPVYEKDRNQRFGKFQYLKVRKEHKGIETRTLRAQKMYNAQY